MPSIALFTEGITDQIIIEALIFNYLKLRKYEDINNININPVQPERDATDENKQAGFGGWEKVFEYCRCQEIMQAAISTNDFILIQIDTDCAEHTNFGVGLTTEGDDKTVASLVEDVVQKIESLINQDLLEKNRHKFLFAISVHSLECWVLHFLGGSKKMHKHSCEEKLRYAFTKQDKIYAKDASCYNNIAKTIKKEKNIELYTESDESLHYFINKINEIFKISLPS